MVSDEGRGTSDECQTPRTSAWVRAHAGKMLFPKAVCELIDLADELERRQMVYRSALQGLCDALVARMTADDASAHVVPLLEAHKRAVGVLEQAKAETLKTEG